jgi:uncharacterized flavoprotein (TIGR03862 family)
VTVIPDGIAVIGGGPAGLMATEVLAEAGCAVTVYDRMPSLGRKLLLAGRGGLNLTHTEGRDVFMSHYGEAGGFLQPVLDAFPPGELAAWSDALGQPTFVGSSGRLFPEAMKASPLLRAWLRRLDGLGVRFVPRHRFAGWDGEGRLVLDKEDGTQVVSSPRATVLALGGASWPRLGADGGWVPILRASGVEVRDLMPANSGCDIAWSPVFRERFAGTPLKRVAITCVGTRVLGEAMITATGIEGGAIYALTAQIRAALVGGRSCTLAFDLRPDISLDRLIYRLGMPRGKQSQSNFLRKATGLSPVAISLLREGSGAQPLPADPAALAARIKALPVTVTALAGMDRAISTAGGSALTAVDAHLMLRARPGVFVAGEMLDWEAPTGGYLLQACFATGRAAARGALQWLGHSFLETSAPDWNVRSPAAPAPADDESEQAP